MKKIIALLLAVTALVGQINSPTSAFADNGDDGAEYWDISRAIDFRKKFKAELAGLCEDAVNYEYCILEEGINSIDRYGSEYYTVGYIDQRFFTITAINPLRNTMRVHYTGKHEKNYYDAYITELYMYWMDDGKITPQLNYLLANTYTDQIRNGDPGDGIHVLYTNSTADGSPLFATDEEIRLVLSSEESLALDNERQIYFTTVNNYGEQMSGFYNYSDCSFSEGLECKGTFYRKNRTHSYIFVPFKETDEDKELPLWKLESSEPEIEIPEIDPDPEGPVIEYPESDLDPALEPTGDDEANASEESINEENLSLESDDGIETELSKAPDTGSSGMIASTKTFKNSDQKPTNSLWWMTVVALSVFVVISFATKPRRNQRFLKKVPKKS